MAITLRRADPFRQLWPDLFRWPDIEPIRWPELWRDLFVEGEPRVEEYEEGDTLVVRIELPGIDPDRDVEISVSEGMLCIAAERHEEKALEEKHGYRSEFRYGVFARRLPLPAGASEADVNASYRNGILEVHIPIDKAKAEARRVPIAHD